jgi:hypothetical protein
MSSGFYVTIIKGQPKPKNIAFAAGPFLENDEALSKVDTVRTYVLLKYPDAHWWTYGTTRVQDGKREKLPVGKLNEKLGFTPTV